jgi:hypothetical protein
MTLTKEEREEIVREAVDKAVEKALLLFPEVVGKLMVEKFNTLKMNLDFYKKNPDFAKSKIIVESVIEEIARANPNIDYPKVLESAVPEIKKRLRSIKGLNLDPVTKVERKLPDIFEDSHGEL